MFRRTPVFLVSNWEQIVSWEQMDPLRFDSSGGNHGPHLENPRFSACHGVFRARRTVFLRHATYHRLD
jgi:hypothetical protein